MKHSHDIVPGYLPKHYIAQRIGITGAHLSLKINRNRGQEITYRDKWRIAKVYREIIEDLEGRIAVLNGSEG